MKVGILGLGVIGSACKYGFEKLGHRVSVHDPKLGTQIEDVLDTEIVYICVPTPSNLDGSCDTSIVRKVIQELKEKRYDGIIVIKSTVKPGTTEDLIVLTGKMKICFVPEFLRERCAITDFTENHDLLAVGTYEKDIYDKVVECHGKYPKKIVQLSPTEAEILKYYSNVYNSMKIIFANEMYEVCKAVGADYTSVKEAFVKRGTTIDMYLDVNDNFRGYGGMCLPKDTAALASFVKDLKLDLALFETIENENKKFKTTVFEGMRK
jgi:UDPglucose 6-dehydrogenase